MNALLSRRSLLAGVGLSVSFLGGSALAAAEGSMARRKMVVVICRGGMDGLTTSPPIGDPDYAALRGAVAVAPDQALKLDGTFGLHPALAPLAPLYRDGRVYCALSDQGRVFCVDANTGEFKWIAETKMVIYDSSFCFGGGNVFIGNVNGTVNAINADSGRFVYQYRMTPGHLLGSPTADDKYVYVGNMAGRVIALPLIPPPPPPK